MFGFGKNKKTDKRPKKSKELQASCNRGVQQKKSKSQGLAGDDLRAQALANAKMARENIGEDVLDRIAEAMTKKQQSATEQAKAQINNADPDKVLDELLFMLKHQR